MNRKFKNKYRIETTRLHYWNYGWNAAYFVTICTRNREHYFGEIENDKMVLTEIGKTAQNFWKEIPNHFPFVKLGEFTIMPNHVHGIIIIDKPDDTQNVLNGATKNFSSDLGEPNRNNIVETHNPASLQLPHPIPNQPDKRENQFGPQSRNLASIIRGYKSAVKKYATIHGIDFAWQSRYYDHIIRDEKSF
ncbi:transposase [Calditrichota bacterium GD2]